VPDYDALHFKNLQMMIRIQNSQNSTEPGMNYIPCYNQPFILVGFEESQAITIELRKRGYNAFSCDLQDCSGGYPEWHLKMDYFEALKLRKWNMVIIHPPCTFTALCGNRWYWNSFERVDGVELCKNAWDEACKVCDHVALEQPKTIMQTYIGKRSQTIHPWQYGHKEFKETWIWLKGLPKLNPTDIIEPPKNKEERKKWEKVFRMPRSDDRGKLRSKTYPGIAQAIAKQWTAVF
jgi:hypothetical protein